MLIGNELQKRTKNFKNRHFDRGHFNTCTDNHFKSHVHNNIKKIKVDEVNWKIHIHSVRGHGVPAFTKVEWTLPSALS